MHCNEGFSAFKSKLYKNFIRVKIEKDRLIIYPIGLEKTPNQNEWEINTNGKSRSKFIPQKTLDPRFIEKPFIIGKGNK